MASNPSIFPQMGMEAMNYGYFMSGNIIDGGSGRDMMGADVTPFHPTMLLEHGFGLNCGAVTVAELGAQFATSNATLASFAGHLSAAQPQDERLGGPGTPPPEEEMECGFDVAGGDSCSAASLPCHGQSGGTTIWSSSSKAAAYGSWNSDSAEPYLAGIPDAAGFRFPLAAAACGPSAPAMSELSLTLCSESSSGSALNAAADQCSSPRASRSALTELPHASYSRYAAVAQEVLNDVVGRLLYGVAADSGSVIDSWSVDAPFVVSSNRVLEDGGARWGEAQRRSDLLEMLQMLDDKYNRCLDEVRSTTAKFNTLVQQGGASIRAPFAHRAVSAMYRSLRRRIMAAANGRPACWGESSPSAMAGDMERSLESALIQKHWAARKARRGELPCCWRPQRGLPERSVAVLKAWMFEHFLKPYPDDQVKDMLAARSGLSRNQVSNWFINARVRIWKPMIEEMYKDLKRTSIGWRAGDGSGAAAESEQGNMLAA